jgi:hypothetical protein
MDTTILRTSTIRMAPHARGKRVWLQGAWLKRAGFERGGGILVFIQPGHVTILLPNDGIGDRHVAGTDTTPIIDVIGAAISNAFPGPSATVTVRYGRIDVVAS